MRELFVKPELQSFVSFKEFIAHHNVGEGDLILTSESVVSIFQKNIPINVPVFCIESYGQGEPSDKMFDAAQEDIRKKDFSRMIAVGGGSVIDMAKALCVSNGRTMKSLFENRSENLQKRKNLLCIPTTCGTGSEVTITAVFDRTELGTKMGITNYALGADYAILIPELLQELPFKVFGTSSIDALIHAIESYLNPIQATIASRMFAERAIKTILGIYRMLAQKGTELYRLYLFDMQQASTFAGIAIANSLPSATHAMSYPVAGKFHCAHGEACYIFLDVTLKKYLRDVMNKRVNEEQCNVWNNFMGIMKEALEIREADDENVLNVLERLLVRILLHKSLKEYGASWEDCQKFGVSCFQNQQRLISCAFSSFTEQELIEMYRSVY